MGTLATYAGARVLVTGDTGFKGAWMCAWLDALGARVVGAALPPPTDPSLFEQARLAERIDHHEVDLREAAPIAKLVEDTRPEVVFHLAAQAIVRASYEDPVATFATNVMGTIHLLDAIRRAGRPCAVVIVTTDKVYENRETAAPYVEDERFGGHDPYSASKGAAEIVAASYRRSYFGDHQVAMATARAGNVIGPGDWALDRLVPDCARAIAAGRPVRVRNPGSVRPWQHVLESLSGYLWLGARLRGPDAGAYCDGWNFGPGDESSRTVKEMVTALCASWDGATWEAAPAANAPHEATLLRLSIAKAAARGWHPVWGFEDTVARTARGYRDLTAATDAAAVRRVMLDEIRAYEHAAGAMS